MSVRPLGGDGPPPPVKFSPERRTLASVRSRGELCMDDYNFARIWSFTMLSASQQSQGVSPRGFFRGASSRGSTGDVFSEFLRGIFRGLYPGDI